MTTLAARPTLRLREVAPAELPAWDQSVRRFKGHRVVHTLAWIRSLEASGFGQARFLVFEKDGEIVGCLPGLLSDVGPFRLFGSPPLASQSMGMGPIFDERRVACAELLEVLLPFLEQRLRVDHIEIVSADLDPGTMVDLGFQGEHWPSYGVPLFPGNETRTLRSLKDAVRRTINRGIKQGLDVRFETDESFVDEHYRQIREVSLRDGHAVSLSRRHLLECFRQMRDTGSLLAVSVYLPNRTNIATGMFTIESPELLLWTYGHRIKYRWHRPAELMTWNVMQEAMTAGCDRFAFMTLGDFNTTFGAELDHRNYRWIRSRYRWLTGLRDIATKSLQWQLLLRGCLTRMAPLNSQALEPIPTLRDALRWGRHLTS